MNRTAALSAVHRALAVASFIGGAALAACAAGAQAGDCDKGLQLCEGTCTSLEVDAKHCGFCGLACAEGEECALGECVASCPAATTACGKSCVDTKKDVAHCGACGNACAFDNADGSCVDGTCMLAGCKPEHADCDGDAANGCEADTATDVANCGACGKACSQANGTATCSGGACGIACAKDHADCDADKLNGCETNTKTDAKHCGACGSSCGNKACVDGACSKFAFALVQQIDGQTVSCSSVGGDGTYTECSDLKAGGLSFPNGVSCNPGWSAVASPYTDFAGFCQALTGVALAQVYYDCGATSSRATWNNHVWGKMDDNGLARHVRCVY